MEIPPILCISGASGSGKTTLMERLITQLVAAGLRVGAVKHALHIARPTDERDSSRFVHAGADTSIVSAREGTIAFGHKREMSIPDIAANYCRGCDMVLAEGYSASIHDKINVRHSAIAPRKNPLYSVRLVVGGAGKNDFSANDIDGISKWTLNWLDRKKTLRTGLIGTVLAGGESSRMGQPKHQIVIDGRNLLTQLAVLLMDVVGQANVIGARPTCEDMPECVRWHYDISYRPQSQKSGPLGGIATALRIASSDGEQRGICVIACDMPILNGEILEYLLMARRRSSQATVMINPKIGRYEPLAAVYEHSAIESIEEDLRNGQLSPMNWLKSHNPHVVSVPEELSEQLLSFNTPSQLDDLLKKHH